MAVTARWDHRRQAPVLLVHITTPQEAKPNRIAGPVTLAFIVPARTTPTLLIFALQAFTAQAQLCLHTSMPLHLEHTLRQALLRRSRAIQDTTRQRGTAPRVIRVWKDSCVGMPVPSYWRNVRPVHIVQREQLYHSPVLEARLVIKQM